MIARHKYFDDIQAEIDDQLGGKNEGFLFHINFMYSYLASIIAILTIENLVFAGIGVFAIMAILMDIRMAILVTITIGMIDIDLIGWMVLNNVSLDSLSYAELVMAGM